MNAKSSTAEGSDGSASKNEELIKHLECLSGVLSELRRREAGSALPAWLGRGLSEADHHLMSAQVALLALQAPLM
jgi:hypothetical protein